MSTREQAERLVESILQLAETSSMPRRRLTFGVIANVKTGETHEVTKQMADYTEAALRDAEAATWEAALYGFTETMNEHRMAGAGNIELGCLAYDQWLRRKVAAVLVAKAREAGDG